MQLAKLPSLSRGETLARAQSSMQAKLQTGFNSLAMKAAWRTGEYDEGGNSSGASCVYNTLLFRWE